MPFRPDRSSRRTLLGLLVSTVFALAPASCSGRPPTHDTFPRHTLNEWVRSDEFPNRQPTPRHLDRLVLHLDASASMQGFADRAGTFEYSRALRAVRSVAEHLDARRPML